MSSRHGIDQPTAAACTAETAKLSLAVPHTDADFRKQTHARLAIKSDKIQRGALFSLFRPLNSADWAARRGRLVAGYGGRARAWQNDPKFGELAGLRIDLYRPAMLLDDDVVTDGKAQSSPFTGRLGRKERVEHLFLDLGRYTSAVVADPDFDALAKVLGHAVTPVEVHGSGLPSALLAAYRPRSPRRAIRRQRLRHSPEGTASFSSRKPSKWNVAKTSNARPRNAVNIRQRLRSARPSAPQLFIDQRRRPDSGAVLACQFSFRISSTHVMFADLRRRPNWDGVCSGYWDDSRCFFVAKKTLTSWPYYDDGCFSALGFQRYLPRVFRATLARRSTGVSATPWKAD